MKYLLTLLFSFNAMAVEYSEITSALKDGNKDKALELVNQLGKSSPDFNKVDYVRAIIAFRKNKLDDAEDYIEKAIKHYPHADTYNLAGGIYGSQAGAANIFSKLGYAKKSKKYLQMAYEADPTNVNFISGLIQFNIQAPGLAGGDMDAVEPLLKQLDKLDKNQAVQLRAQYLAEEEDEEAALKYISTEINLNPEALNYRFAKAFILIKMDKSKEAFKEFTYVVDHKPENWKTDNTWANTLYQRGKLCSVEEIYLEIGRDSYLEYINMVQVKGTPDKSWATYRLGLIYQHLDQDSLAQKAFEKALTMSPEKNLKNLLEDQI